MQRDPNNDAVIKREPFDARAIYCSFDPGVVPMAFCFAKEGVILYAGEVYITGDEQTTWEAFSEAHGYMTLDAMRRKLHQTMWTDLKHLTSQTHNFILEEQETPYLISQTGMLHSLVSEGREDSSRVLEIRPSECKNTFAIATGDHDKNKVQAKRFMAVNHHVFGFASDEIREDCMKSSHVCDAYINYLFVMLKLQDEGRLVNGSGLVSVIREKIMKGPFPEKINGVALVPRKKPAQRTEEQKALSNEKRRRTLEAKKLGLSLPPEKTRKPKENDKKKIKKKKKPAPNPTDDNGKKKKFWAKGRPYWLNKKKG